MNSTKKFHIYVQDNGRYMDESCRRLYGIYDTYEDAYNACRFLVEDSVNEFFDYDRTEEEIVELYMQFGIEPCFDPQDDGEQFRAFDYAKQHIKNLINLKPYLD